VEPNHIVTGVGLTAVLNQLFQVITDAGDGVLIAAPYYPGFDYDLTIQNESVPIPVSVPKDDKFAPAELGHLEKALISARDKGTNVRVVILCNPHNPLGQCYTRDAIIAYGKFCEKHDLHLVSDEIYAFSVFSSDDVPNPEPFVSALSINWADHGVEADRVHVLYGMSKDFNANGFRIGVLISQHNSSLIKSLELISFFMLVSSPANALWSALLSDKEYCTHFIQLNQNALKEAYSFFTSFLKFHKIPYEPSNAGHFMMIDLRHILQNLEKYGELLEIGNDTSMEEREMALTMYFMKSGLFLNPGVGCHADEPGWFRATFAVRRDHMVTGLQRIEKCLRLKRWDGLESVGLV
jgi:1-aminocyclopropane-1-carboxylate synthase